MNELILTDEELNELRGQCEAYYKEFSPEVNQIMKSLAVKIGLPQDTIRWIDRKISRLV